MTEPKPEETVDENEEIPGKILLNSFETDEQVKYERIDKTRRIVLCKIGEHTWSDRFTGWYDSELSELGKMYIRNYSKHIKDNGIIFDFAVTSELTRAKQTLSIILEEIQQPNVETQHTWLLNARHTGALTGLNIEETIAQYSFEQVDFWTKSYILSPPAMNLNHKYYDSIHLVFSHIEEFIPTSDSYETTQNRIIKYWNDTIIPLLQNDGINILIVCHGSTIYTITNYLEKCGIVCSNSNEIIEPPFYYIVHNDGSVLNKVSL